MCFETFSRSFIQSSFNYPCYSLFFRFARYFSFTSLFERTPLFFSFFSLIRHKQKGTQKAAEHPAAFRTVLLSGVVQHEHALGTDGRRREGQLRLQQTVTRMVRHYLQKRIDARDIEAEHRRFEVHGDDHGSVCPAGDIPRLLRVDGERTADRGKQHVRLANSGIKLLIGHMAEIAQVNDAQSVRFDDEDRVRSALGALDLVMPGGTAREGDTVYLGHTGVADDDRLAFDGFGIVVVEMFMADSHDIRLDIVHFRIAGGGVAGVRQNARTAVGGDEKARVSVPFECHMYPFLSPGHKAPVTLRLFCTALYFTRDIAEVEQAARGICRFPAKVVQSRAFLGHYPVEHG